MQFAICIFNDIKIILKLLLKKSYLQRDMLLLESMY